MSPCSQCQSLLNEYRLRRNGCASPTRESAACGRGHRPGCSCNREYVPAASGLSGRRGVATLVRSFPVAVAFPFIAASLRRSLEVCNNIADNLSKAGWSWGCVSAIASNERTIWVADAHRDDGKRFVVRADELLTALELRSMPPGACRPGSSNAPPRRPLDAQLSAPASHLPTPTARD